MKRPAVGLLLISIIALTGCKTDIEKARACYAKGEVEGALEHAEKACGKGDAAGCALAGTLLSNADDGTGDRAREYAERACAGGMAQGCTLLGMMLVWSGEDTNHVVAREYLKMGCEGEDLASCNQLGIMWFAGEGGERDAAKARPILEDACKKGHARACNNHAALLFNGEGGSQDKAFAWDGFEKACESGDARACDNLGEMFFRGDGVPKNSERSRAYYKKACDLDEAKGCWDLRMMWQWGEGGPTDEAKIEELSKRARNLSTQACEGGVAESCYLLGDLWRFGHGGPKDETRTRELFEKACDMGSTVACLGLSDMWRNGHGGEQDEAKAQEYSDRGWAIPVPGGSPEAHRMLSRWMRSEPCVPDLDAGPKPALVASGRWVPFEERKAAAVKKASMPTKLSEFSPAAGEEERRVWLVITRPMFEQALEPLVSHRRGQGFEVEVSTLPPGKAVATLRGRPGYVLIVGDDQTGTKNAPWQVATSYRTFYRWQSTQEELYASDASIGDLDGDLVPDEPVGRIPVRTEEELETVVSKILAYESREPDIDDLRLPVWAGNAGYDPEKDVMATMLAVTLLQLSSPSWLESWLVAGDARSPACGWPAEQLGLFTAQIERGGALLGLIGHASADSFHSMDFKGESFGFHARAVENLRPSDDPAPPMVIVACEAGVFVDAERGLAESILLTPGAPVAVIGATTESHPLTNYYTSLALLKSLSGPDRTIGSLWQSAQNMSMTLDDPSIELMLADAEGSLEESIDISSLRRDHLLMYALLGDPATRMHLPGRLEATAEIRDDGCHWRVEKVKGATKLLVQLLAAGQAFPGTSDIEALGKEAALDLFEEANATFGFETLDTLDAGSEWSGLVERKGVLRLVVTGPGLLSTTTFVLM